MLTADQQIEENVQRNNEYVKMRIFVISLFVSARSVQSLFFSACDFLSLVTALCVCVHAHLQKCFYKMTILCQRFIYSRVNKCVVVLQGCHEHQRRIRTSGKFCLTPPFILKTHTHIFS